MPYSIPDKITEEKAKQLMENYTKNHTPELVFSTPDEDTHDWFDVFPKPTIKPQPELKAEPVLEPIEDVVDLKPEPVIEEPAANRQVPSGITRE